MEPSNFTYDKIRNHLIAIGQHDRGTVRYATRRVFVSNFTFERKSNYIEIDESINTKFKEISTRKASFNNMSTDEKLKEIVNLIELLLKKNGKYLDLNYSEICYEYISNETVKDFRRKIQCFRHATEEALEERNTYTKEQKDFFIDYGIIIIKAIHKLLEKNDI